MSGERNRDNNIFESYSVTNDKGFVPQVEQFENGGTMTTADKSMYYIVSKNSFAYNPARINVGSIGYYDKPEKVIVSSLYEVFKTINNINDRFLWHWFKSDAFQKMIEQYQEGGVRLYFYYDKLCVCLIDIPKYEEQYMIGEMLDKLDNLITLHQRKYDKLVNVKKAMLEKMFPKDGDDVPEIRFKGFTEAWEQRKLGSLAIFNPKAELPNVFEYVDLESVVGTEMLSHRTESKRTAPSRAQRLAQTGDLFYQTVRPYQKNNFLFEKSDKYYVFSTGYAQMRPVVDGLFLLCIVQSNGFMKVVLDNCTGTSYPSIKSNDLAEIEVYSPINPKEQEYIGKLFKGIDNLITLHQRKF